MQYLPMTRNDPSDIERSVRREIRCRFSSCDCGCLGADPWHRASYGRVVRSVVVHSDPVCINPGRTMEDGTQVLPAKYEVARAQARLPGRGLATVRCVVRGDSRYADWELVK